MTGEKSKNSQELWVNTTVLVLLLENGDPLWLVFKPQ
jgi:hypothetical protein